MFLFLHDEEKWLNQSQRDIAEEAGVALGSVKPALDGLKEQGFLIKKDRKTYRLKNKRKLLDQWITAFSKELKPRITTGRYSFLSLEAEYTWKKRELDEETMWGGEPAADIITKNLQPKEFILYTRKTRGDLMKSYKLKPDEEGRIEVRTPYWKVDSEYPDTAPLVTVYVDLMESGDPRNMNIANELYEANLNDRF